MSEKIEKLILECNKKITQDKLEEAINIIGNVDITNLDNASKAKIYQLLYKINKRKNNFAKAFDYQKKSFKYKNKVLDKENEKQLQRLNKKYNIEVKKKEKEIYRLENIELKKINLSKDKFFSIVAHDLRSPFSTILSFISILKKHYSNYSKSEIHNLINELNKTVNNSYHLLINLLEWSRFQSGILTYNPEKLDIKTIVKDIVTMLKPIAEAKKINIKMKLRKSNFVFADEFMINTVLRNLINNAIKFTPIGGEIIIRQRRIKNYLKIFVIDNGIGLEEENRKKLFKLGENFSTLGTNKEKGTGLGLILCEEFITINKGHISVKSVLEKGSTFYFTLPIYDKNE